MRSQNWFQRHPNGTAVFSMLLGITFAGLGSLEAADRMATGLGALIYYFVKSHWSTRELILVLIGLGLCLPVLGWTFKQKKGSIWWPGWIVLPFLPFGWIATLFIGRPVVEVLNFGRPIVVPPDDKEVYGVKYWRGLRQTMCWAAIIATVELVMLAWTVKEHPNAPLWARIGSQDFIRIVVGGFLLYGALRK